MPQISIKSNQNELIVEPNSGQVIQWICGGVEVFYQGSSVRRSGIPILFPFANPLTNNILLVSGKEIGQHGFGRDFTWRIGEQTDSSIEMILTPQDISLEMQNAYPFDFEAKIKLQLAGNNLVYTLQIANHGDKPMPIAPGIHPYFPIQHNQKSNLIINKLQSYDSKNIDWEKESNGYFYNFDDSVEIVFPNGSVLDIKQADQKEFNYLVVWSQTPTNPDSDFVCIEPFTRYTNAINDDPIIVSTDEIWSSEIIYSIFLNKCG
jgi:galactose mutarotase-like enzyme